MRQWSGRVRTADAGSCLEFLRADVSRAFAAAEGNLGHQFLVRTVDNGLTEIVAISWWASWGAVASFAGPKPKLARHFPEADLYLVDRAETAEHYNVMHDYSAMVNSAVLL
jgi:heme-degrading monooxygenase HmoA